MARNAWERFTFCVNWIVKGHPGNECETQTRLRISLLSGAIFSPGLRGESTNGVRHRSIPQDGIFATPSALSFKSRMFAGQVSYAAQRTSAAAGLCAIPAPQLGAGYRTRRPCSSAWRTSIRIDSITSGSGWTTVICPKVEPESRVSFTGAPSGN